MADGSIVIKVDAETKKAQRELAKLERDLQKTAAAMEKTGSERNAIVEQLDQAREKAQETRDAIAEVKAQMSENAQAMGVNGGSIDAEEYAARQQAQKEMQYEHAQLEKQLAAQERDVSRIASQEQKVTNKLKQQTAEYERQKEQVAGLRARLADAGGNAMDKLKAGAANVSQSFGGLVKNIVKWGLGLRLATSLVRKLKSGIVEGFRSFAAIDPETKANIDGLRNSLTGLKLAWGAAFAPVVNAVAPILQKLIGWLTTAANAVNQFFSALMGRSTYKKAVANIDSVASSAGGAAAAADDAAESMEEAKKQLMGFDEINRLEDTSASKNGGGSGGGGGGGGLGEVEEEAINPKIIAFLDWVKKHLDQIKIAAELVGLALLAWRLSRKLGTSFIKTAGILLTIWGLVKAVPAYLDAWVNGVSWDNLHDILMGVTAAVAGITLAFGSTAGAIAMLIGGVAMLVLGFKDWIKTGEMSKQTLTLIDVGIGLVGIALAVLTGSWIPLAIAAVGALLFSLPEILGGLADFFHGIGLDGIGNFLDGMAEKAAGAREWLRTNVCVPVCDHIKAGLEEWKTGSKKSQYKNGLSWFICEVMGLPTDQEWIGYGKKALEWLADGFSGLLDELHNIIGAPLENLIEVELPATWAKAKEFGPRFLEWLAEGFLDLADELHTIIGGPIEDFIDGLITWWDSLSLSPFHIPHPVFEWTYSEASGMLAKALEFVGLPPSIPHLSISWMARGGIVDGATLIGAGEAGKEAIIPLERNTEWIRKVALELMDVMESRFDGILRDVPLPAMANGSIAPPRAVAGGGSAFTEADIARLVSGIAGALSITENRESAQEVKVYLDGKQLANAITKWQRRDERAGGI